MRSTAPPLPVMEAMDAIEASEPILEFTNNLFNDPPYKTKFCRILSIKGNYENQAPRVHLSQEGDMMFAITGKILLKLEWTTIFSKFNVHFIAVWRV